MAVSLAIGRCVHSGGDKTVKNKAFRGMLAGMMILFAACGQTDNTSSVELHIFTAASMTETMDQVIEHYQAEVPGVTVIPTYDSSGTLLTQIQEGRGM